MPITILSTDAGADDSAGVELTQYARGDGEGLGLQLMVGGAGYTYLSAHGALRLGALLTSWARDVLRSAAA